MKELISKLFKIALLKGSSYNLQQVVGLMIILRLCPIQPRLRLKYLQIFIRLVMKINNNKSEYLNHFLHQDISSNKINKLFKLMNEIRSNQFRLNSNNNLKCHYCVDSIYAHRFYLPMPKHNFQLPRQDLTQSYNSYNNGCQKVYIG